MSPIVKCVDLRGSSFLRPGDETLALLIHPPQFFSKLSHSFNSMALSAGTHPRRKTKNAYDPDFLYDFPSKELFHDHEDDFNFGVQGAPVPHSPSPIKHSPKPAKAKSTTAHSGSFCQCAFYQLEAVVRLNGLIELQAFSSVYGS